jgi:hypothetical protein
MDLDAETIISSLVKEGDVLPGQVAGETYTISDVGDASALEDGKVYFWARGQSSIVIAGVREGIWSYSAGTFTAELIEGNGIPNNAAALKIGKFDANDNAAVIKNFTLGQGSAIQVSVRVRGNGNAASDRAVIYHKDGVNTLLVRSAAGGTVFTTGVSLLAGGAAFSDVLTVPNADPAAATVYSSVANQGLPNVFPLAAAPGAVVGQAGANYDFVSGVAQAADGNNAYLATITANGQTAARVGVSNGIAYTFPLVRGTPVAGTGGGLQLLQAGFVLPGPGNGWWLVGGVQDGNGGVLGFQLPFLFQNNELTSLFPGGVLAALFGEDGATQSFLELGESITGDLAMNVNFQNGAGDHRFAVLHRNSLGAYRLIAEENRVAVVDGVARAVTGLDISKQPFSRDGKLYFGAELDGNQATVLVARMTEAAPIVRLIGRDRRRVHQPRLLLSGTASDDGTLTRVNYQVNRRGAAIAAGTTRWQFRARLNKGRNRILVYAVDGDGNTSNVVRVVVIRRQS